MSESDRLGNTSFTDYPGDVGPPAKAHDTLKGDVGPPANSTFVSAGQAAIVGAVIGAAVGGAVGAIAGMVTQEGSETASGEATAEAAEGSELADCGP